MKGKIHPLVFGGIVTAVLTHSAFAQQDTAQTGRGRRNPMQMMMTLGDSARPSGAMIVPMIKNPILPGLRGVLPRTDPFLPGEGLDTDAIPPARPREIHDLAEGDTLVLEAMIVKREIGGKTFVMYGYNGQYPGPLIRVPKGITIHVKFTNNIELPTTVHWHGLRLDNRFDGVPGVTQDPVGLGETFWYQVTFPDPGIYWYHPHIREDIQQDLGLYGNMLVRSPREDYDNPVNREEFLVLDDMLIDNDQHLPFGKQYSNFTIMGRFGNVLLVNGEDDYGLSVNKGDVVRFYITNVANARTYNLSFGGAPIKLIASDVSKYEREMMVESVVITPAERYVVEVHFAEPGEYTLGNHVQAVDHVRGEFYPAVDALGTIQVTDAPGAPNHAAAFAVLREDPVLGAELERFRSHFGRPVDHELLLTVDIRGLPILVMQFISIDTVYRPPVEFTDAMPHMNWLSTTREVTWILRDTATKDENMDILWTFTRGDVVKIRLRNDPDAFHPMNHPIHFHGQRFLVLSKDGVANRNLVWKDTSLIPVGSTVDILLEASNPGTWMMHCHIAEHLEAGMMGKFVVVPN